MFEKILIANRGEIAVRIMRTCKRLGILTVAVYSDVDSRSLHVFRADEAVNIGKAESSESYLNIQKVVDAALSTGCQAIHPGYGFLSENPEFAYAVEAAGLIYVGPPQKAISLLGDKIASKQLAVDAGVPVIPGHPTALKDLDEALAAADRIGYPVLLKPAAGGGGKGMRIVCAPDEMASALGASREETRKAFGENRMFLERYIEQPRHIEIQVLADTHGHIVHLGERECSIQRRYQKVIEESPSPAVTEDIRQRMGQAACNLAGKAGYVNAGTVEFVMDSHDDFYFLEMNTRLQVEHPVTEMVTETDLVALQISIAAGKPIPFDQKGVVRNGWAMEARICAEDPDKGFMPSTGMVTRYAEPKIDGIRVDSGVDTGSKISIYYDSMIAKVISHGRTREEARTGLIEALNGYHIEGFVTNIDFINSILCHPEYVKGHLDTGFIENHFNGSQVKHPPDPHHLRLAALAATLIYHVRMVAVRESLRPMISPIGRGNDCRKCEYLVKSQGDDFQVTLEGTMADTNWKITVNGQSHDVVTPEFEFYRRRLNLKIDKKTYRFRLRLDQSFIFIYFNGITRLFEIYSPREWQLIKYMPERIKKIADNVLLCPMPGQVIDVRTKPGDRVYRGQTLVTLESMKMESGVSSPIDGDVAEVLVVNGQTVEAGEVLVKFNKKRKTAAT